MNENLIKLFDKIIIPDYSIKDEGLKKVLEIGKAGEYGTMDIYSVFPGVILSYVDMKVNKLNNIFLEENITKRMLEINHCFDGRYAYQIADDKLVYFRKGDLCVSISDVTKAISDFPLGYYRGLELFIDIDVANEHVKNFLPDFDLIELYESLKNDRGYVLIRANEKIDHVIGELYAVDDRIKESYFKLKCLELLLFFSITKFKEENRLSLSKKQSDIIENVKNDLVSNLNKNITIDELAQRYNISKTSLKNCFKEVYGKPIYKWKKEYKLNYACRLIEEETYPISEISKMVGYSSPSKFSQAFKEYVGCSPSEFKK